MEHFSKLLLLTTLCLFACARQGQPTGGPKDTTPPRVDSLHSTPNYATRFVPKRLELKFDEWVVLADAAAQIVVSPPLAKRPEVLLRGKKVIVKFDENEKFRDSTTYTINFGTAIKDLHEKNPAKDLRFVFSTGDFIDSLVQKGQVVDVLTGAPIENISVMLYDDFRDSVLRKDRPYYFSRTDKAGQYEIRNVKAGRFKLAAVEDLDQNLRWDGEGERIAFLDTTLLISDTGRTQTKLRLFKNQQKFRLSDKNVNSFGAIKLKFSATTDSAVIATEPLAGLKTLVEKTQDSLVLWYDMDTTSAWKLFVNLDTIPVKALSREDFLKKHVLRLASDPVPVSPARNLPQAPAKTPIEVKTMDLNPLKPAVFEFNYPISAYDSSKWQIMVDTIPLTGFGIALDTLAPRKIALSHKWVAGKSYKLEILPGAVIDFWGQANTDTLRRNIVVPADKQLGGLTLLVADLTPGRTYVVQLLNGSTVVEERAFIAEASDKKLVFNKLLVATYEARLLDDRNRNGRWDTGNYWAQQQPEPIVSKKLDALRANWEVEANISLNLKLEDKKKKK